MHPEGEGHGEKGYDEWKKRKSPGKPSFDELNYSPVKNFYCWHSIARDALLSYFSIFQFFTMVHVFTVSY